MAVAHLDRQLAPPVETPGREVDRADDRDDAVGEQHLAVKPQVLEFVDLDPDIIHDPQAADSLHQLVSLEGVRWTRHDVDAHAATRRSDQPLDDHHVLEALVLDEQPVARLVDESADPIPPRARAPDDMAVVAWLEGPPVPVSLEALDDLGDVVAVG